MRSFLGKIFLCMLLVPILARGFGMVLESTLSDHRPQSERALALVLPSLADFAGGALRRADPHGLDETLRGTNGMVRLLPAAAAYSGVRAGHLVVCAASAGIAVQPRGQPVAGALSGQTDPAHPRRRGRLCRRRFERSRR
jgi:hypothetical protein